MCSRLWWRVWKEDEGLGFGGHYWAKIAWERAMGACQDWVLFTDRLSDQIIGYSDWSFNDK